MAAADDDGVPVARGQLGDRLGQADLAQARGDLVRATTAPVPRHAGPPALAKRLHVALGDHDVEGVDVDLLGRVAAGYVAAGANPLWVSSHTCQSSRLTWSQKSIASEGSKPSAAIVAGSKNHSQTTSVRSTARGQSVWSIT